jgi:hypothetical protein
MFSFLLINVQRHECGMNVGETEPARLFDPQESAGYQTRRAFLLAGT